MLKTMDTTRVNLEKIVFYLFGLITGFALAICIYFLFSFDMEQSSPKPIIEKTIDVTNMYFKYANMVVDDKGKYIMATKELTIDDKIQLAKVED
jgi:hypothetical protein